MPHVHAYGTVPFETALRMAIRWQQPHGRTTWNTYFSTTVRRIVDIARKQAVQLGQVRPTQASYADNVQNKEARAGISRRKVLRVRL